MIESASILVTGGSGAFGTAFARRLLQIGSPPKRVVIYSRGEFRQFQMAQELAPMDGNKSLRFFIGDVRDRDRLRRAMERIDIVVHAAALKRIEVGNYNPIEMVKTNIDGAINLIEAAQDAGVRKVVFLSSDKAYEPVSPYGQSKALAESLFLAANNTTGWVGPKFAICRYGNVWGSTGSVVPVWQTLLACGLPIEITDPECTRFFMRMREAVDLVLDTIPVMAGGEINIPTLPAYRLGDLAEAIGAKDIRIKPGGLPPWEKKHESMAKGNSSDLARRMTVEELQKELRDG